MASAGGEAGRPPSALEETLTVNPGPAKAGKVETLYLTKVRPVVANGLSRVQPVVARSRAGGGSQPIIVAALCWLMIVMVVVFLLVRTERADEKEAAEYLLSNPAVVSMFDDGTAEQPECNAAKMGPLIADLEHQTRATRPDQVNPGRWAKALQKAKDLRDALEKLEGEYQPEPEPEIEPPEESLWYVGVAMSCSACLANVFGYNIVRMTHSKVEALHAAGKTDAKATHFPIFYLGWSLSIVFCGGLDIMAYGYAPVEMLAPLGGVTLMLNIWVAPMLNDEKVYPIDVAVSSLIIFGIAVTVLSVPTERFPTVDATFVYDHLFRGNYVVYETLMLGSAWFVYTRTKMVYGDNTEEGIAAGRAANPKLSKASILLWPWVGSVFTSNMNVYIKTFLEYSGGGWGVALEIGPYFVFGVCGVSTMLQLNAINNGLAREGALTFVPLKTGMNVLNMSMHSCTFFLTIDRMGNLQTCRYIIGLLTVVSGVLLILTRPVPIEDGELGLAVPVPTALGDAQRARSSTAPAAMFAEAGNPLADAEPKDAVPSDL